MYRTLYHCIVLFLNEKYSLSVISRKVSLASCRPGAQPLLLIIIWSPSVCVAENCSQLLCVSSSLLLLLWENETPLFHVSFRMKSWDIHLSYHYVIGPVCSHLTWCRKGLRWSMHILHTHGFIRRWEKACSCINLKKKTVRRSRPAGVRNFGLLTDFFSIWFTSTFLIFFVFSEFFYFRPIFFFSTEQTHIWLNSLFTSSTCPSGEQ